MKNNILVGALVVIVGLGLWFALRTPEMPEQKERETTETLEAGPPPAVPPPTPETKRDYRRY